MSDELKPCPVCGAKIEEGFEQDEEYWVACESCSFESGYFDDPNEAVEDWNNHLAQDLRAQIEALRKELDDLKAQAEWKPIESAPEELDILITGGTYVNNQGIEKTFDFVEKERGPSFNSNGYIKYNPTKWRHLSLPPEGEGK